MNIRLVVSLTIMLFFTCSCASPTKQKTHETINPKSNSYLRIAEITGEYNKIERIDDLPTIIIDRLRNEDENCPGVAGPSEEYNPSCGVGYGDLPCRKLLSAGNFNNIWFIEFLTGGAGVMQTFIAYRLEGEHIASLVSFGTIDLMNNHGTIKLSTQELNERLPYRPICSENKQFQHIIEIKHGLCNVDENSFYRRFVPK